MRFKKLKSVLPPPFILVIPLLFSLIFIQCSKGSGTIAPIIPSGDYAYQSERVLPPDGYDYGDRSGYQNRTNVLLQVTAPAEYITSQLNPPLVTDNQPTFSAIVHNNISQLSDDDFIATVDGEHVRCMFNPALNEVSFTPATPLKNGNHHAMLIFKNPDGSPRSLYLSFRIDTKPPNIDLVMWSKEYDYALIIFDRQIETERLSESSRWRFNAEQDILRNDVVVASNSMVLLPLTSDAFDINKNRVPLTVSFTDINGIADYVVRRGGSMVRKVQGDPPCNCSGIDIIIAQDIHYLEAGAEDYAFCYTVCNPNNCDLTMEWEGWTLTPIDNVDPTTGNGYELNVDTACQGFSQTSFPGVPYPLAFTMPLNNLGGNLMKTVTLPREYKHNLHVSFWADCELPAGEYETWIADQHFAFHESFDCLLPVFDEEPIVLYGDEAAEFIHELMDGLPHNPYDWPTRIPVAGENINGDLYCFSLNRNDYSYEMEQLVLHNCDLFIVTKASDPTTQGLDGNMAPQQMVLDYKYTDGTYDYGNSYVGGDPLSGTIVIDKKPWACRYPGFLQEELELSPWMDDDWPPYLEEGGYKHDWCGEEIAINWWNLTDILTAPSEKEIKEVKVRITDNTHRMPSGYHGNWRRSADVMEQLCAMSPRGGSVHREGAVSDPDIELQVEPGIPAENQNDPQLYWIDGPAIPIFGSNEHPTDDETPTPEYCWDNWDMYTLQHKWLSLSGRCPIGSYIPTWETMRVGQILLRVCINCDCIVAFRVYAKGPNGVKYDVKPDPNEDNIYFTDMTKYSGPCSSPPEQRCLDTNRIKWDISRTPDGEEMPCGEYVIYIEAYDEAIFRLIQRGGEELYPGCYLRAKVTAKSPKLELDKVKQSDLVRIASIYEGDDYWSDIYDDITYNNRNGYRPRNNHDESEYVTRTVDCSNYVTQLLRRLDRKEGETYPINQIPSSSWRTSGRVEFVEFSDMVPGDILVWMDTGHVAVLAEEIDIDPIFNEEGEPVGLEYNAWVWEAWGKSDDPNAGGVGRFRRQLGIDSEHLSDLFHWHEGRHWIDDSVFNECPEEE